MNSDGPKPRDRLVGEFYRIMILSRSRNRYRDRDRDRIVRHSDFDSDFDFDQERTAKPMLFYPVKDHPPAVASSVIRVIKPNRRAACIDQEYRKKGRNIPETKSRRGVSGRLRRPAGWLV